MAQIAFDGFDQIRDQIITAAQLDFDLSKAVFILCLQGDELVVDLDQPDDQAADQQQ